MTQIVVMPALGNSVESCLLTQWQVAVGDSVSPDTVLCDIETDKSAMEVPAGVAGVVLELLVAEGDEVPVKAPLAVIGAPGESVDAAGAAARPAADPGEPDGSAPPEVTGEAGEVDETAAEALTPPVPASPRTPDEPEGRPAREPVQAAGAAAQPSPASPRARGLAERVGVPLAEVTGTGPHGRILERDVAAAEKAGPRPTVATRGADRGGVDVGFGLGGRVTAADLAAGAEPESATRNDEASFRGRYTDTPLTGVRKLIAERMLCALQASAQLTYTASAAAGRLLELRRRFKESDADLGFTGVTVGDLVCYAAVRVVQRHPGLNAHLLDGTLRSFESVHLGLAVDTPRGLLVPTIRDAHRLTLRELSAATKELAAAARSGRIAPDLLTGATFTVSNLGSFGIEHFTPIVNVPQTGILGVNAITPRAVIGPDGNVAVEQRLGLSLTADHQVVDGADAGRFLADLTAAIEAIDLIVLG